MRDRLVAAFVALTIAVIALYGVPRAFYVRGHVEAEQEALVERSAAFAAALADGALADGEPVDPGLFRGVVTAEEAIVHRAPDGTETLLAGTAVGGERIEAVRPLADGGTVTVLRTQESVAAEVRAALLPLLVIGVALVGLSALVAVLLARRLSRPFSELAGVARQLGTGDLDVTVPRYRIPEAEAIGRALEHSAERLDTLVRRERQVAARASHELRTPITALRLTLEDLALWPETDAPVAEELHRIVGEVDRLSRAVTGLLEESEESRWDETGLLDLGGVVSSCLERWEPVAEAVGLALHRDPAAVTLRARVPGLTVTRVVDLLLQHACEAADGAIEVSWGDRGSHLAVEVAYPTPAGDAAPVVPSAACVQAAQVAAAVGGRLATEHPGGARTTRLVLLLPVAHPARRIA